MSAIILCCLMIEEDGCIGGRIKQARVQVVVDQVVCVLARVKEVLGVVKRLSALHGHAHMIAAAVVVVVVVDVVEELTGRQDETVGAATSRRIERMLEVVVVVADVSRGLVMEMLYGVLIAVVMVVVVVGDRGECGGGRRCHRCGRGGRGGLFLEVVEHGLHVGEVLEATSRLVLVLGKDLLVLVAQAIGLVHERLLRFVVQFMP